jgi:hypothetical protein
MSDISLEFPWYLYPLLIYMTAPWWALVGALAGGALSLRWSRRHRQLKTFAGAFAGSLALPLLVLAASEGVSGGGASGDTTRVIGLGFLGLLALAIVAIIRSTR